MNTDPAPPAHGPSCTAISKSLDGERKPTSAQDSLGSIRDLIDDLRAPSLPEVIAELASLQAYAVARMVAQQANRLDPGREDDALLSIEQAASRLGVSRFWIYRNAKRLPFARRIGPRALRFSSKGIARYLDQRRCG